ncbi:MAG: LacI family DNA-binding transcriptional regulator [Anaerolineae bacterium]
MKKRTTIDDVAREAGVSRQTVSRAMNGMDGISVHTRDRVLETIDDLGYRPSRLARGMASSQSQTIGLIIGNITDPAHANVVRGLHDVAEEQNHNVFLRNSDNIAEKELEALKSLAAENVDGIVIASPRLPAKTLATFADSDCPIIVVHRNFEAKHISSITTDSQRATRIAVEYLIGAGHKQIGLITRPGEVDSVRHVWGYKQTLEKRGLHYCPTLVSQGDTNLKGGYEAAYRLLTHHKNLTAIATYNDLMALGAMKACADLGRSVPNDVSIVGYDDTEFASFITPTLTTLRIQGYDVGRIAFKRLMEMIARPDEDFPPVILDIELVIRESTSTI